MYSDRDWTGTEIRGVPDTLTISDPLPVPTGVPEIRYVPLIMV